MSSIKVNQISKRFGNQQAVDGVSFEVEPGEIFGLLGPNGAGKTTSIRIILDIFKPDSGEVEILGGKMTEEKKESDWIPARRTRVVSGHHPRSMPELSGPLKRIKTSRCRRTR